jgi:hypothetical protein
MIGERSKRLDTVDNAMDCLSGARAVIANSGFDAWLATLNAALAKGKAIADQLRASRKG